METPQLCVELEQETEQEQENYIIYINQYNLEFDNIDYLIKFGKQANKELILFIKEENIISSGYYQKFFTLQQLQKKNKYFESFNTIDEIIGIFNDIILEKKLIIKNINEELSVIFKINIIGKEEEIIFRIKKKRLETEKLLDNLISYMNKINLEINSLKNENKTLKEENKMLNEKIDYFLKNYKSNKDINNIIKGKDNINGKDIKEDKNEIIINNKEENKKENKEEKNYIQNFRKNN